MAYDRYDTRGSSRERGRADDSWRDRDRDREFGRRDERGFFERAREEIGSWFSDEDDERERRRQFGGRERDRSREFGRDYGVGWGFDPGRDRDRERFGRPESRGFGERDDDDRSFLGTSSYRGQSGDYGRGQPLWSVDRSTEMERGYRPMTGDYGRGEDRRDFGRGKFDRDDYRRTSFAGSSDRSAHHDPHYSEWRQRQIEELDRDYDEYRREHQSKFESDFGGWREKKQTKRQMLGQVREHMEVLGKDEQHVGTVDRVAGDRIILTKSDEEAGGAHHSLPCTAIDRVEENRVILDCSAEQAKQRWRDENRDRALFEREDQGEAGPMNLERSFSGTYR